MESEQVNRKNQSHVIRPVRQSHPAVQMVDNRKNVLRPVEDNRNNPLLRCIKNIQEISHAAPLCGDTLQRRSMNPATDGLNYLYNAGVGNVWFRNASGTPQNTPAQGVLFEDNTDDFNYGDKTKALESIAKRAGKIGDKVKNFTWTNVEKEFNTAGVPSIDSFLVRIKGEYQNAQHHNKSMETTYHFGNYNHGYVTGVKDTANSEHTATMSMQTPLPPRTYSNVHEDTGGQNLLEATNADRPVAWDAHTKLAGEGARFMCVRNHLSEMTDRTRFYTKNGAVKMGVAFNELWLTWSNTFNSEFNIPENRVAKALKHEPDPKLNKGNLQNAPAGTLCTTPNVYTTPLTGLPAGNDIELH